MKLYKGMIIASLVASAAFLSGCGPSKAMMDKHMMLEERIGEIERTANTADYNASVAKQLADEAMTATMQMRMHKGKMMKKHMGKMKK